MNSPATGRPRLLLITERFPPDIGGVARSAARIAGSLSAAGAEAEVFTWTRMLPPGRMESIDVDVRGTGRGSVRVHRLGVFAAQDFSLQYSMNVLEWLQLEHRYQLIWGHYVSPAGFLAVLMAERAGIRSTVSARGNDIDRLMFPPGDFSRLLWTLGRAGSVTAVSSDLAGKVRMLLGTGPAPVVLPNVVDPDLFVPGPPDPVLRAGLGIADDEVVLGFCGELRQKKGLVHLLQALVEVRSVRPACLLVIGEVRTRDQAQLSTFLAEHPETARRIVVTGPLEDPAEVARRLRLCDLVLVPSLWEGMPNALLEAMACGRVVIASDAGGIPEVVRHGENGVLIPKSELGRLGAAVLEVLGLPSTRRQEMGEEARRHVLQRHHPDTEVASLRHWLSDQLPGGGSSPA